MVNINDFFTIILFTLLSILLVVLIILGIKMIKTLKKVNAVVDDIDNKQKKLNGLFNVVDGATDALSTISDKFVSAFMSAITGLFKKKKKENDEDE